MITNSSRKYIIESYCKKNNISPSEGIKLCSPDTALTVVIPAFNEEIFIRQTLLSLGKVQEQIEIVVVDNDSTDNTRDVVRKTAEKIKWAVSILGVDKRGPVHSRKRGMDEVVVQYFKNDPEALNPRYIAAVDADTRVPKNWVKSIIDTFSKTKANALGGIHEYPHWIDERIELLTGISDFYRELSDAAYYLTKKRLALIQTNGANFAIEVSAYAAIGGSKQPIDENGNLIKGSDRLFGYEIRRKGGTVAFISVKTITSARSALFALCERKDPSYFRNFERWVDCRYDEKFLLKKALGTLNKEDWLMNKRLREIAFIGHNVIQPAIKGELELSPLEKIMGTNCTLTKEIRRYNKLDLDTRDIDIVSRGLATKYADNLLEISRR